MKEKNEFTSKIFYNILLAIIVMVYFFIINIAYKGIGIERLEQYIEIFAGVFMLTGIIFLEVSYRKDDGAKGITAIEFLFLSMFSLSIMYSIKKYGFDLQIYLAACSYIFAIYYTLKSIIIYTKGKKQILNSFSDIKDIVKKEEPVKKEAIKRNKQNEYGKVENQKKERKPNKVNSKKTRENKKNKTTNKNQEMKKSQIQTSSKSSQVGKGTKTSNVNKIKTENIHNNKKSMPKKVYK